MNTKKLFMERQQSHGIAVGIFGMGATIPALNFSPTVLPANFFWEQCLLKSGLSKPEAF